MGLQLDVECVVEECSNERIAREILDRCPNAALRVSVGGGGGRFLDHDIEVLDENGDEFDWLVTELAYKVTVSSQTKVVMAFIEKGALTRDTTKITALVE